MLSGWVYGGTWACYCGAPGEQPCIFTETLDVLSFVSLLVGLGMVVLPQLCSHNLPVLYCLLLSGAQGREALWVLSRAPGCTWNGHKQDIDRGNHLSPCTFWSRWPNLCTQWSQQSCSKLPQYTMWLFIRKSQPQSFLSFAKAQQFGKMSYFNVDAQFQAAKLFHSSKSHNIFRRTASLPLVSFARKWIGNRSTDEPRLVPSLWESQAEDLSPAAQARSGGRNGPPYIIPNLWMLSRVLPALLPCVLPVCSNSCSKVAAALYISIVLVIRGLYHCSACAHSVRFYKVVHSFFFGSWKM